MVDQGRVHKPLSLLENIIHTWEIVCRFVYCNCKCRKGLSACKYILNRILSSLPQNQQVITICGHLTVPHGMCYLLRNARRVILVVTHFPMVTHTLCSIHIIYFKLKDLKLYVQHYLNKYQRSLHSPNTK